MTTPSRAKLANALAGIWERSREAVLERVSAVEDAAMALVAGALDPATRRRAEQEAHKLAGTAGTFGYHEATDLAREAEQLLAGDATLDPSEILRVSQIAVRLRDVLEQPMDLSPAQAVRDAPDAPAEPRLVVWSSDAPGVERLVAALRALDCAVATASTEDEAASLLRADTALLVDLTDDPDARWDALERLHARVPERVLIACAGANVFADRIRAARAGVSLFLEQRTDPVAMADAIAAALQTGPGVRRRALAVDDDPHQLAALESVLRADDFDVTALTDPLQFWDALTRVRPDLVVLDIDMPGATGIELLRAIRASAEWSHVVTILVSARTGAEVATNAFAAGADDFLPKPYAAQELLARIARQESSKRRPRSASVADVHGKQILRFAQDDKRFAQDVRAVAHVADSAAEEYDVAIVDDDAVLVELLTHSLASRGYRTLSIGDGTQAIEQLGGASPRIRPKVIVLDVGLPGKDGFTVLRMLNRDGVTRRSRVIMLTLRSTEREVVEALALGAVDHVAKPFSIPVLMQRIRRAVEMEQPPG